MYYYSLTDFFLIDLPTSNNPNSENHKKMSQNGEKPS